MSGEACLCHKVRSGFKCCSHLVHKPAAGVSWLSIRFAYALVSSKVVSKRFPNPWQETTLAILTCCLCCRPATIAPLSAGISSPAGVSSPAGMHIFDPLAPGGRSGSLTAVNSWSSAAPSRASSAKYTEHLRPWEVQWEEFACVKQIGGGSFGKVGGGEGGGT